MPDTHRSAALRFWRLPWLFDAAALQAEVAAIAAERWQPHFNTGYHDGGWSGLALVSADGEARRLYAGPEPCAAGRATALLDECPALAAVLGQLPFTIQTARLLRLAPGSHIREHSDHGIGLDQGSVRLHVPVTSAPEVEFYVDGQRVPMAPGECWYLDLGRPHRVHNGSEAAVRVHLVIDCQVDDHLLALLPPAEAGEQLLQALTRERPPSTQQCCQAFLAEAQQQPDTLARLEAIDDPADLAAQVVQLAAAQGQRFTGADVLAVLAMHRRSWIERHLVGPASHAPAAAPQPQPPAGPMRPDDPLDGWLPVAAQADGTQLSVELCHIGHRRLTEPFFEDSVAIAMQRPAALLLRRRVDAASLARAQALRPGLAPTGFVFHLSRCGSTLLAQVLAASPQHRVLSEPPALDAVLRDGTLGADDPRRQAWLRAVLGQLGRPATADERRLFVKFDSWHAGALAQIRRAWPAVPWLFLMREPAEIIVSHLRRPGAQMVPGMIGFPLPGVDPVAALTLPREEYCARMLGTICEAALQAHEDDPAQGLIVDYRALTDRLHDTVLPHLGVPADRSAAETDAIAAALRRDAKQPQAEFQPDSEAKQRLVTDAVQAAAERWVGPAYRRLLERAVAGPPAGR